MGTEHMLIFFMELSHVLQFLSLSRGPSTEVCMHSSSVLIMLKSVSESVLLSSDEVIRKAF